MAYLTPNWVPLKRVCKFPNVLRIYKRAGRGQGTGQGAVPPFQQTLTTFATTGITGHHEPLGAPVRAARRFRK